MMMMMMMLRLMRVQGEMYQYVLAGRVAATEKPKHPAEAAAAAAPVSTRTIRGLTTLAATTNDSTYYYQSHYYGDSHESLVVGTFDLACVVSDS
jgi:hypothetical protein